MAILTALAIEEEAVVKAIGNCSAHQSHGQPFHLGDIAGQRVLVFRAGVGNAIAAAATSLVINAWHPARLILAGIAAGAKGSAPDMRPGDILVSDQVVGYEQAKVTLGDTARRYEVYRPDPELLARARSMRPADWADGITTARPDDPDGRIRPLVHVGPVLTGDKVVADKAALAELRMAWPKAIGVEMESLGVALAAYQSRTGFLMVKAVSDFADNAKGDAWQRYAAEAAARFAVAVLARPAVTASPPGRPAHGRSPVPGVACQELLPRVGRPLVLDVPDGNGTFPVAVHAEPVELLCDVDILVVPQNVYLEMSQHFKVSVSAAVGRASARRSSSGEIVADVVGGELRDWIRRFARPGLPVAPGTLVATSPGEMGVNRIRRLYHVAITAPLPGTNDYHVDPSAVARAVRNVLATARAERDGFGPPLRSIAFPLLGAGRGGLDPAIGFSWLWAALERERQQDPGWEIHFIARTRVTADLIVAGLVKAGAVAAPHQVGG